MHNNIVLVIFEDVDASKTYVFKCGIDSILDLNFGPTIQLSHLI